MKDTKTTLSLAIATGILMMTQANAGDIENTLPATTDAMTVKQGATELMRVNGDGNVGIGTITPTASLHIVSSENNTIARIEGELRAGLVLVQDGGVVTDGSYIKFVNKQRSDHENSGQIGHIRVQATSNTPSPGGDMYFSTQPDGNTGTASAPRRMVIKNDGNVGIGTATPTSKLQVTGLPIHADNVAASTAGLTAGAFFHNGDGILRVVF